MIQPHLCPRCGKPLPQNDALIGRCPFCLLQRGFESAAGNGEDFETAVGSPDPAAIGRYRVLRRIGEGGMGVVYEAEQDHPRRTVALKIIKPGMASSELLRRFEQESQALGRLQHPGIAQIYEAGTVDTGFGPQPYFAMELIRGSAPREYAEAHQLGARERLEIMAKICDAVHHAHQRGLIHRDLKPGNILIDESGQPKILDFGVARVTDSDARATIQTDMGQLIGTLAYMSPEQVLADPMDIDRRSDVYSLGVVLYEFLSGRLPYPISKKIHETIQSIREEDPAKLSVVSRIFRGDIETIVAKALEKDRSRRYGSAAEMAADLRRYLNDEAIVARPTSAIYQLLKFARRNKAFVSGIAAVFALLVAGTAVISLQERKAVRERDHALQAEERALRAERATTIERDRLVVAEEQARRGRDAAVNEGLRADMQADTARELSAFLQSMLTYPDSRNGTPLAVFVKPNPNLTVREILDRAAASIDRRFDTKPLAEAEVREAIAASYLSLGLYVEGQAHLKRAVELRKRTQGQEHPDTLKSMQAFADLLRRGAASLSANHEIEFIRKEIMDIEARTLGREHPQTLADTDEMAYLLIALGRFSEAEPLLAKNVAIRGRIPNAPDSNSVRSMTMLVASYEKQGKPDQARQTRGKLENIFRLLGDENDITQEGLIRLVDIYSREPQRGAEMEADLKRILAFRYRYFSTSDPQTLFYVIQLVQAYQRQAKNEQADQLSVTFESMLRALGESDRHFITLISTFEQTTRRRLPGMVDMANAALPVAGTESQRDLARIAALAQAYSIQGKYSDAESLYTRALDISNRFLSQEARDSLQVRVELAVIYVLEGQYDRAENSFKDLLNINRRVSEPDARLTLFLRTLLGWTRLHQQKYAEVEVELREILSSYQKSHLEEWEKYYCQSVLGASLAGQKKFADAETFLISAYDGMITRGPTVSNTVPFRPKLQEEGGEKIVQLYLEWGKPDTAADWREKIRSAEALRLFGPPRK